MIRDFDELNNRRSEPYKKYFSIMALSKEQIEERINFSKQFEDIMFYILNLIDVMIENKTVDITFIQSAIVKAYSGILSDYIDLDDYLTDYIEKFATEFPQNTIDNQDDPYYLSLDRALYVSENEANSICNYKDMKKALLDGKTEKTWITQNDNRVRWTHVEVHEKTIPIDELFVVGNSLMQFPKDISHGADANEIVNCRCSIKYS